MFGAREAADFEEQVGDDGEVDKVDEEENSADGCWTAREFVEFERAKAGGGGDGEESGVLWKIGFERSLYYGRLWEGGV